VNLFDPGVVRSRLRTHAFPAEDPNPLPRPEDVAPTLAALCLPDETRHGAVIGVTAADATRLPLVTDS
jgi:hypothetical protein